MRIEGTTFDASKIRTAEILGREDLIRVRTGGDRYQRQDARSLLNPQPTTGMTSCRLCTWACGSE
jgi:hypothetical protein